MMGAPRKAAPAILRVRPRHQIWSVTLDGRFFGDYRSRQFALAGAEEKAQSIRARGGAVEIQILTEAGDLLRNHPIARA